MVAFEVMAGTRGIAARRMNAFNWRSQQWVTRNNNLFFAEDVVLDAQGILNPDDLPRDMKEAAGIAVIMALRAGLAPEQCFGFLRDGCLLVVHASNVRVG